MSREGTIYRIAITGPESTGKSTLAEQLAAHYQTVWVPEYAREYLNRLGRPYEKSDLIEIAKGQIAHEKKAVSRAQRFLFCDTDLTVIKIWYEYKYSTHDPFLAMKYAEISYDLWLLCDIDLPWQYDPQREHPEKRRFFFDWFERELKARNARYAVISGVREERLQNAVKVIDSTFAGIELNMGKG